MIEANEIQENYRIDHSWLYSIMNINMHSTGISFEEKNIEKNKIIALLDNVLGESGLTDIITEYNNINEFESNYTISKDIYQSRLCFTIINTDNGSICGICKGKHAKKMYIIFNDKHSNILCYFCFMTYVNPRNHVKRYTKFIEH